MIHVSTDFVFSGFNKIMLDASVNYTISGINSYVTIIFEFSHFHTDDFAHGREFVDQLDRFFGLIPRDWQYAAGNSLKAPGWPLLLSGPEQ